MADSGEYKLTVGLEIHAELKTKTKMFCGSKNDPDETRPNVNVCPVCMAHPGTLPVINMVAVKSVLRVGLAVGGTIADYTEFDRKNYFYPDIPKGYQLSQYKYPLVSGGEVADVKLTRIHLEEDTASSEHQGDHSLVNYNRAGVPLMELVTEPVITSAKQAGDFAREFNLLLRYLDVSEANLEKGEMRIEANISVSKTSEFGTKVEVKNLNSFRSVERAIEFEQDRQIELLEKGEQVVQETRGFDEDKGITFSQRKKESSHDYRYFPDPDLPKLKISEIAEFSNLKETIPELPWQKRTRYETDYQLKPADIDIFVENLEWALYFEHVAKHAKENLKMVQLAANYILSDLVGFRKADPTIKLPNPDYFAELIGLINEGKLSSRGAKDVLKFMLTDDRTASDIAKDQGLFQQSDLSTLEPIIDQVLADNPQSVADFKAGKAVALQFLLGQAMKLSKGAANPGVIKELLEKKLSPQS